MQTLSNNGEQLCDARKNVRARWYCAFKVDDLGKAEDAWTALEIAFKGNHPKYEAIDAPYHDLDHTLSACSCYVDLVLKSQQTPDHARLPQAVAELGLIAILFHDTGYLKNKGDLNGTGAKYAFQHVDRSQVFAKEWMLENDYDLQAIAEVNSMILTTDFSTQNSPISFASAAHQLASCMVGTADLLGQMASPDYIKKLPLLHQEMMEALDHDQKDGIPIDIPQSPQDLLRLTPSFFREYVTPKLQKDYQNVVRLLNDPYPNGPNPYMEQIHHHIESVTESSK